MQPDKELLISRLSTVFEPELAAELAEFPIFEIRKGNSSTECGYNGFFIPLIIEGGIKISNIDVNGNEIEYYPVNEIQCCILSITAALRQTWNIDMVLRPDQRGKVIAVHDTKLLALPPQKANEWMEKYVSWQKFVMKLYQDRLRDLINQQEVTVKQKNSLEHQNRQITDSIHYARRIQNAMLPTERYITEVLPEHFILFKPRDIVSGDYYWITRVKSHKTSDNQSNSPEDVVIIAIADCTGHGVPGAFMSLLGISFLNEIVTHIETFDAADILNLLRSKVKQSLHHQAEEETIRDGMDMALCIFDFNNLKLQYAGAYNPLYLIRNTELTHFKADKMPIGIHLKEKDSFTNNFVELQKDDVFYMFSDGYIDQFGGTSSQKFMSKKFKQLLTEIHEKPMAEQKQILEQTLDNWKQGHDQVDDILVMGIRI